MNGCGGYSSEERHFQSPSLVLTKHFDCDIWWWCWYGAQNRLCGHFLWPPDLLHVDDSSVGEHVRGNCHSWTGRTKPPQTLCSSAKAQILQTQARGLMEWPQNAEICSVPFVVVLLQVFLDQLEVFLAERAASVSVEPQRSRRFAHAVEPERRGVCGRVITWKQKRHNWSFISGKATTHLTSWRQICHCLTHESPDSWCFHVCRMESRNTRCFRWAVYIWKEDTMHQSPCKSADKEIFSPFCNPAPFQGTTEKFHTEAKIYRCIFKAQKPGGGMGSQGKRTINKMRTNLRRWTRWELGGRQWQISGEKSIWLASCGLWTVISGVNFHLYVWREHGCRVCFIRNTSQYSSTRQSMLFPSSAIGDRSNLPKEMLTKERCHQNSGKQKKKWLNFTSLQPSRNCRSRHCQFAAPSTVSKTNCLKGLHRTVCSVGSLFATRKSKQWWRTAQEQSWKIGPVVHCTRGLYEYYLSDCLRSTQMWQSSWISGTSSQRSCVVPKKPFFVFQAIENSSKFKTRKKNWNCLDILERMCVLNLIKQSIGKSRDAQWQRNESSCDGLHLSAVCMKKFVKSLLSCPQNIFFFLVPWPKTHLTLWVYMHELSTHMEGSTCSHTSTLNTLTKNVCVDLYVVELWKVLQFETRSSAQGNCSAKSLAASVMLSILPCSSILPGRPCPPPVMLSLGGGGSGHGGLAAGGVWLQGRSGQGEGGPTGGRGGPRGEGAGDILVQLPYTALPHGASP